MQLKKGHLPKPSHLPRSERTPPSSVGHARLPGEVADRHALTGSSKGSLASAVLPVRAQLHQVRSATRRDCSAASLRSAILHSRP